ncbi:MAG TPA: CusA/CzcA family heavy metal efflux RND transporter [Candidatus Binatia bacterium]|jgi:cobalt-zinc-cadmium resistance protein CzcA|nr:CusA/CzcA family heavy metal efflux RND transporter [Candidatus Binatia bacterium]
MLERILRYSIDHRALVVVAVFVAATFGGYSLLKLPIDAVPDITNQQVQINAVAPSLSPVEVEKQVTFPIETALAGIEGLAYTRSFSRNGFSQVTAVFHDDVDIYFARQQVSERLASAREDLPPGIEPLMGPISTGLGEIYMWTVEYQHPHGADAPAQAGVPGWQPDGSYLTPEGETLRTDLELAAYLRTVQDWIIRPQLKGIEGVAGIDAIGGYVKQYHVQPDPRELAAHGLTFNDLLDGLERSNVSTGAGYIEHNGESYIVRAAGRLQTAEELTEVVVGERGGTPIYLSEVATVGVGRELRTGSATENGEEVVVGTAFMLLGANSRTVSAAVDAKMAEVNRSLPPDIRAKTVLDRSRLVDATIHTVQTNLAEGALLVVIVLFLMLGNFRAACITALAIPLSMLLTAIGMVETKTSGNLMSLGAIDFGLIVDGAVIIVENCLRRLAERQHALGRVLTLPERLDVVFDASKQVRTATAFGEAIIITVYIPILTLTGVEGKMFQPMALTVIFALLAAFVLSLTFVPAMVALCITGRVQEQENRVLAAAKQAYEPAVRWALRWRRSIVAVAVLLFGGSLLVFRTLGQEFAPTLSELDIVAQAFRIPSTSLTQATEMQRTLERRLQQLPEVAFVFSRTGTAEMAADPMPPYISDTFIILKPRAEWPDPKDTKDDVRDRLEQALAELPGNAYEITQPIQMRFNELLAGVRGDLAVKVFGDEFDTILPVANRIAGILDRIPGAADTRVEEVEGAPVLSLDVDRRALARYGLSVADVHDVVAIAIGGKKAGQLFQGDRRFDVVVRLPEEFRSDPAALQNLPIPLSHEDDAPTRVTLHGDDIQRAELRYLPLSAVAKVSVTEGPNQISRENGKRRIVVQTNVRGRDIGSFVEEAQREIAAKVTLPAGSWLAWGGQFENLVQAKRRLAVVVPICFLVILFLLYGTFRALRPAAIVFTAVPLALTGGILSLWLRGMPFSISAAVGFIALSGVAVLNGLVMITFINELRLRGLPSEEAIVRGAVTRLRPVLMTALVASLGFFPMALATGTGAEVQRPLATVVIGGLVSSTVLTLFVLPALYRLFAEPMRAR